MEMDFAELLDRFTITTLKKERIGGESINSYYNALREAVNKRTDISDEKKNQWIKELYEWNSKIWDLEYGIRLGIEGALSLEEIGRRTINIRTHNKHRVGVKNRIIKELGEGFEDVKMNHASE